MSSLCKHLSVRIAAVSCVLAVGVLAGCTSATSPPSSPGQASQPKPWVLSTPESAVRSYLDWVSYAYRIDNSAVASKTMGPDEGVRIDSYLELNRQKNRRIDQQLTSLTFGKQSTEATHTLVPTRESWTYVYLSLADGKPIGAANRASYDATYTLASPKSGQWVVESVDVKAIGEVK